MNPLKAKIKPEDMPAAMHNICICFDDIPLNWLMLDKIKFEPRDTMSANSPEDNAAATAELTATRHAMFEKGRILVKNHE